MDDGILERRTTSPMATACLLVSFVALLGAITFNLIEIGEIRAGGGNRDATRQRKTDFDALDTKIQALLKANADAVSEVEKSSGLDSGLGEKTGAGDGDVPPPELEDSALNPGAAEEKAGGGDGGNGEN